MNDNADRNDVRLGAHATDVAPLVGRMTLAEKLGQMSQLSAAQAPPEEIEALIRKGKVGSFLNALPGQRNRLQRIAVEESRLGVPLIFGRDVIHGYRTVFPIPLGQSGSFDPPLVERAARVAAREATADGIDWTFAPMVDIARDARWGRVAEGCGEDPLLASALGAAMVRGYQGDDPAHPESLVACAKHFAGYGAAESGKDYNGTWIPEQALREIFLAPFKACVDAGVLTLMSGFHDLNGVPASGSELLLRRVLRDEWGFRGFVVSDWTALTEMMSHGFVADEREAARAGLRAGVDMEMVSRAYVTKVEALLAAGQVQLSDIDAAVGRILAVKRAAGLFQRPYAGPAKRDVQCTPEHLQVAQQLATESVVLLKNDGGALPLARDVARLAVLGPLADSPVDQMGCWTMDGRADDVVTPLAALRAHAAAQGRAPAIQHARGVPDCRRHDTTGIAEAVRAARAADAALLFVGEDAAISGEAKSRAFLDLPGAQGELVRAVADTGRPVILVVMAGRPLAIPDAIARARAVLWAFHPGTMGGPALVRLLFGLESPSGKLSITLPRTVGQVPIYYAHKNTGRPPKPDQRAGVPLGTPLDPTGFTCAHIDVESTPLYPFGFGLSYGAFAYTDLRLSSGRLARGEALDVTARLANRGTHEATEVAQLYVRDLVASVTRPVRQLKGFQRVRLAPGEARDIAFRLTADDLAFVGQDGKPVVEPGSFQLWIGGSSTADLGAEFEVI